MMTRAILKHLSLKYSLLRSRFKGCHVMLLRTWLWLERFGRDLKTFKATFYSIYHENNDVMMTNHYKLSLLEVAQF